MPRFTNKGMMGYARYMCDYNSPYWFGVKGFICSEALYLEKKRQYPSMYPPKKWTEESFRVQYGKKGHDCSGLPAGYLMSPCIDDGGICTDPLKPSKYNPRYDISANDLIERCKEKGDISTLPEIEGLILWREGHVALYDGKGYCIEARGHAYGTVRSKVSERGFKMWGKHPDIEYISEDPQPKKRYCKPIAEVLTKGDQGTAVKVLQSCLNLQGYSLSVDGHYGNKTDEAVRDFQSKNKIKNAGTVGVRTWDKIIK